MYIDLVESLLKVNFSNMTVLPCLLKKLTTVRLCLGTPLVSTWTKERRLEPSRTLTLEQVEERSWASENNDDILYTLSQKMTQNQMLISHTWIIRFFSIL